MTLQALLRKRDLYAGLAVLLLGIAIVLNALTYKTGTLTRMGPGMFPVILGCILALIGSLILGSTILSPSSRSDDIVAHRADWRGWGCILAGPALFIPAGHYFGMAAAAFVCVFISALGDRSSTFRGAALLGAGVAAGGCLLFGVVLKSPLPMFPWGF